MRIFYLLLIVFGLSLTTSCKSKRNVPHSIPKEREIIRPAERERPVQTTPTETTTPTPPTAQSSHEQIVANYIAQFKDLAKEEMRLYGIPASIKMAQGILESGAGRGNLASRSNNHFGIKCHQNWTGAYVRHDDDELQECFRKYNDPKYSFRDHSLFLTTRPRYNNLFTLAKDDYKGWARGLRQAGYATDPQYAQKLINIIERYELYKLDAEVLGNTPTSITSNTYRVQAGDTLFSISRRHNLSVDQLKKLNNLEDTTINVGQLLKVSPK